MELWCWVPFFHFIDEETDPNLLSQSLWGSQWSRSNLGKFQSTVLSRFLLGPLYSSLTPAVGG